MKSREPQTNDVHKQNRQLTGIEAMLELRESDPLAEMRQTSEQMYRHQDKSEYIEAFPEMSKGPAIHHKTDRGLQ
jgi:hypothetical protein